MRATFRYAGTALLLAALFTGSWGFNHPAEAAAGLELYGTFHAMGVIVHLDPADDPDLDGAASLSYRSTGTPG